jgi:serine/threonine protein kinase
MLTEGTVLQGRYRIIRQLGQGGMGAVYEAIDERLDTTVALKETFFAEEKLRKQFEREARLLARMHHPALPRVSDHFNEGDGQFLVMQYVAGQDLSEMLAAQNAPFPEAEVVRWADQLCDALDYLHTQDPQIIHRDIKPQNLKLTARGQVVLLDFGLAKGSVGQLTAVTTSASIFGYTPNYAPLEQVQGKGTDARSDLYALGATLYHLVTNVKPPDALSRASALVNGQPDPMLPANEIRPEIGAGLANVLDKAMSQKRDDRFATADDMRRALGFGQSGSLSEETLVTASVPALAAAPTITSAERATRLVGDQTRRTTSPSFSSEAQTLVAGEATSVRTVTTGQGAVAPAARNNLKPVAAAVIVLIVAAAGVAGLLAYRRQQAQQSGALTAEPQTQSATQSSQPSEPLKESVGPVSESKGTSETGKTSQAKTDKSKPEPPKTETQRSAPTTPEVKAQDQFKNFPPPEVFDPAHQADPNRGRERNPQPGQPPPFDPMRPPEDRRMRTLPRLPEVRVLPNGGRIIKQPDGSVIMISPKGETKIIPAPGQRPKGKGNTNGNDNQSP